MVGGDAPPGGGWGAAGAPQATAGVLGAAAPPQRGVWRWRELVTPESSPRPCARVGPPGPARGEGFEPTCRELVLGRSREALQGGVWSPGGHGGVDFSVAFRPNFSSKTVASGSGAKHDVECAQSAPVDQILGHFVAIYFLFAGPQLDCSVDSFWLVGFVVWFVVGPGGFWKGPGSPRNPDGRPWGSLTGAPGAPGTRTKQPKNPFLFAGPFYAAK